MVKLIGLIILIFLFVQPTKGQELYGKFLDQEQGLLSNECYDINYDENGYLIVGTQYGPMKYNGEKFIPICTNLPIERRIMYDFEKDPNGNTYLLNSQNELFKLQNDKAIWIGPKNLSEFKLPALRFTKLNWTPNGIYICTFSDFLKYSFKSKKVLHYYKFDYSKTGEFKFVYNSKKSFPFTRYQGSRFAKNSNDINIEFPESKQAFHFKRILTPDSRESQIKVGNKTYLLICMKLFKKEDNHLTDLDFSRVLFFECFHNRLWLCTFNGLMELDLEGNLIHHHFKGEIIGGVAPLRSGGIAVSFNNKGVFISSNIHDRIHYNFTATSTAHILKKDLVGNMNGGVFRYQDYMLTKIAQSDTLNTKIRVPYQDGIYSISLYKNSLLFNSSNGLSIFTSDLKKIKTIKHFRNIFFESFIDHDNMYFISRVSVTKTAWKNLISLPHPYKSLRIPINYIKCHIRLNDSTVLFGTNTGLLKYNLKTNTYSKFGPFKKELQIVTIHFMDKNNMLVCTRFDGIYIIRKNKIIRKIKSPCISISKALIFHNQLILEGNDGIYIQKSNNSSGLPWIRFFNGETKNICILSDCLFISYKKNLIIKKLADYKLSFKPAIRLNKFQLNNLEIDSFPKLIPPNKSISIDLDILQFDANKLDLYYKLKGENTISQFVEGTNLNFDALKSGDYQLQIYPVIDGEIRFNNSKKFHFTVEKTFWESTIFYILIAVILLSIIVSILLLMNLRRKKRSEERSKLESKLNEYKLLAVKAQVNPHFLSNGLAAIQALILKGDNDNAAHYLAKFSYLMRKILYYSETQFISVKQELQLIDSYLELELLRFRNRFEIRKEIDLSESQLNEFNFPSLLLQPIFENAIWHGLKFQENNPQLLISFKINQNQELVVVISDNGPGFNLSNQNEEHLSKGNKLISERIDALNKQFQKQVASMEVISSESGTKVIFIFSPQLYKSNPI